MNKSKDPLVQYWLDKAEECIASAKSEINAGRLSFAVNRLYYAVFYSVTAALAAEGKKVAKHSAVRAAFHKDYVRTGRIERSFGRLYDELFHARHQGDYTPMIEFEDDIVRQQAHDAEKFVAWFKNTLREIK